MVRISRQHIRRERHGQTAIEYMLLLAVVTAIVLAGFSVYMPVSFNQASLYFNEISVSIMGDPNPCGDGFCSPAEEGQYNNMGCHRCPVDCGC